MRRGRLVAAPQQEAWVIADGLFDKPAKSWWPPTAWFRTPKLVWSDLIWADRIKVLRGMNLRVCLLARPSQEVMENIQDVAQVIRVSEDVELLDLYRRSHNVVILATTDPTPHSGVTYLGDVTPDMRD